MRRCLIWGCKQSPEENIKYYRLTNARYYSWMEALGRNPNENVSKSNVLCSRHFSGRNYCIIDGKRKLRKDAVPDINLRVCKPPRTSSVLYLGDKTPVLDNVSSKQDSLLWKFKDSVVLYNAPTNVMNYFRLIQTYPPDICKTCCEELKGDSHPVTTSVNNSRTTCKDMIIHLVPQMAEKLDDTDEICTRCYDILTSCVQFIHRCLKAEAKLQNSSDIVEADRGCKVEIVKIDDDRSDTSEEISGPPCTIQSVVDIDHSYVSEETLEDTIYTSLEDVVDVDTAVSIKRPDREVLTKMVANFASADIRVFDCYSRLKRRSSTKRVLLLGTSIPPQVIQCDECGKILRNKRIAIKHEQTHKRGRERKELMRRLALQRKEERRRARHAARLEAKNKLRCPRCHEDCGSKDELKEHIKAHPLLVCEVCGKGFADQYKLRMHVRMHYNTKTYICDVCGRCCGNMTLLKQHKFRHEDGKFLCSKCPKIFRHNLGLKNHMKRHDAKGSYECKDCGKKCKTKAALRSHHRLVHLKDGNLKCEICGETFVRGDYLKRHVKKHTQIGTSPRIRIQNDAGPFMCKICNKVFSKLLGLKHHLYTHASLKPHRCRYCGLTFNRVPNKYRHEKRHERDPYAFNNKCPVCWRLCENEVELMEHISHHPTPYQCEYCDLAFARRYLLTHHVSETHTILTEESMYYESMLQESLDVKYPRTEFLFENQPAES